MGAKVIMVVLILVVWAVLVSASAHAARVEAEETQDQQPRANTTRIVLGAMAEQEDGDCESPRPVRMQHDSKQMHDQIERVVCPNV